MREAVEHLIHDRPQKALKLYAANDALHLAPHHRAAMEKLIADYGKLKPRDLPESIALTATNEDARHINEGLQRKRKASRQLGFASLKLPNGERVYKNDRILVTVNDYKLGLRNGFLGTVEAIHWTRGIMGPGSITVRLDDLKPRGFFARKHQPVTIDLKKYPDVQLGYAVTTHKLQSGTKHNCFVFTGDATLSKEMTFSQMTRGSHMTKLYGVEAQYGDSITLLAKQMTRKTEKDLAHDHTVDHRRSLEFQQHSISRELNNEHTRIF
jgi:ATP-dependent exoDNAse (exonuclease V) alpha subunit